MRVAMDPRNSPDPRAGIEADGGEAGVKTAAPGKGNAGLLAPRAMAGQCGAAARPNSDPPYPAPTPASICASDSG
ncbi:MAG: hypothetical protein WAK66_08340, partial [Methylocystis sp.]